MTFPSNLKEGNHRGESSEVQIMAVIAQAIATDTLTNGTVRGVLEQGLGGRFANAKVLVLIPDHTRTLPLPMLFRQMVDVLHDTRQLDFMVALGTHLPESEDSLNRLVGISADERSTKYPRI